MVPQADQVWHSTSILYIQHSTQLSLDAVPQRYPGSHLSDELAGVRQVFGQTTSRRLGSLCTYVYLRLRLHRQQR